jgi:hypothetical protein
MSKIILAAILASAAFLPVAAPAQALPFSKAATVEKADSFVEEVKVVRRPVRPSRPSVTNNTKTGGSNNGNGGGNGSTITGNTANGGGGFNFSGAGGNGNVR